MSHRVLSCLGPLPRKSQNPQKTPAAPAHLQRRSLGVVAAEVPETSAVMGTRLPGRPPVPIGTGFCGDSRDFCGSRHPAPNAAGQTSDPQQSAAYAVFAAPVSPVLLSQMRRTRAHGA